MNVRKTGPVGFTQIFTSDHPSQFGVAPKKSPYIVFTLNSTQEDLNYIRGNHLARLGIVDFNAITHQLIVTVTSDRKVMQAIDILTNESSRYPCGQNSELLNQLSNYKETCRKRLEQKAPKETPHKSKPYVEFEEKNKGEQPKTANVTRRVVKKKNPQKKYIHKENPSGRSISELETFNGFCYRLLLGDRHPKVRAVHGEHRERAGLVSKKFKRFESLHDRYNKSGQFPTEEELLQSEVGKVWVASYVEEENDLHGGNYGIGPDGFCVKIDDDQATWPLTSKYSEVDSEKGRPDWEYPVPPDKAFPVTQRDILDFPKLEDAKPSNWPDRSDSKKIDVDWFLKNKKFINDKWYMFLKRILIPREVYEAIGLATISSYKKRKEFVDHKCNKTEELKRVLLNTPEFQEYVISSPQVIQQIKAEFAEYNKDYKKEDDAYLRVDLNKIEKNFNHINRETYARQGLPETPGTGEIRTVKRRVPKPGFFKRHPWVRDVLIGAGIGLLVVGAIAITAVTYGGALPVILGAGTAVGTTVGLSGALATGVGLGAIGAGCVAAFSAIAGSVGAITRKISGNPTDRAPAKKKINDNNYILIDEENDLERGSQKRLEKGKSEVKERKSYFDSSLNKKLRQDNAKASLAQQSMFKNEPTQQDIKNIDNVVRFLTKNIEFFAAPFQNQKEFSTWVSGNEGAKKLSSALMDALKHNGEDNPPFLQYQEAILGGAGKDDGLINGNDERINELLVKNAKLRNALMENINNPAISDWYQDNNIKHVSLTKNF